VWLVLGVLIELAPEVIIQRGDRAHGKGVERLMVE
jgi:hypothetical protein